MKIPLSLIKSYIDLDLSCEKIAECLTLLGIEVEKIENAQPSFSNVVVGYVQSTSPHPSAEKLKIAKVDDGKEIFTVVCGAFNCREGIKTAFAKIGATLLDEKGIERRISKVNLRGVESYGMLCSEKELLLPSITDGIIELPIDYNPGDDLRSLLSDPVFEISLTPNLGHVMSALGIARELSAYLNLPLKKKCFEISPTSKEAPWTIKVEEDQLCPIYFGAEINDVTIAPSPFWLQKILLAAGIRPISNAVDIGNYILLKTGQPLHIFDRDALMKDKIFVTLPKTKISFEGLDDVSRELSEEILTISDEKGPLAIAGILGAKRGSTQFSTKNLLVEAAFFDPKTIHKAMKKLDLRTESSQRFEKGIDPEGVRLALLEAVQLLLILCEGKFTTLTCHQKKDHFPSKKISCRPQKVNALLGSHLSISEMQQIFTRLHLKAKEKDSLLEVEIPSYRSDLNEEIDLIEEVARIYGYGQLEEDHLAKAIPSEKPCDHDPLYLFEKEIRKKFLNLGLQEILTSDLISPKLAELAKEWLHPKLSLLTALKPKTEDYSILRPSLLPGMLEVAAFNLNQKNQDLKLFEIGNIHLLEEDRLLEQPIAAILLTGNKNSSHFTQKSELFDFFDLKGMTEVLLESQYIHPKDPTNHPDGYHFEPATHPSFWPYSQANLFCKDQCIGSLGKVHPNILAKLGIEKPLFYAEINLELFRKFAKEKTFTKPLPKFPSSERDLTIAVSKKSDFETIWNCIQKNKSPLLEKVELIDLYYPEDSEEKRLTFRFSYRDPSKTLSFEEVESFHQKLVHEMNFFNL